MSEMDNELSEFSDSIKRRKCGQAEREHRAHVMQTMTGLPGLFSCKPVSCGRCPGLDGCKVNNNKLTGVLFES